MIWASQAGAVARDGRDRLGQRVAQGHLWPTEEGKRRPEPNPDPADDRRHRAPKSRHIFQLGNDLYVAFTTCCCLHLTAPCCTGKVDCGGSEDTDTGRKTPEKEKPFSLRPIFLLTLWISEGLTQA